MPTPSSRSSWWGEVAWAFSGERLDEFEREVLPFVAEDLVPLLKPQLAARHEAVVRSVDRLPWDLALASLKSCVDRDDPEGDVPHATILVAFDDPLKFARGWWDHLCEAHLVLHPLSVTAFAVSAYAVSGSYALRGDHLEARRWARVGAETTEFDPRGLSLVTYIRSAKLLSPLVRRVRPR